MKTKRCCACGVAKPLAVFSRGGTRHGQTKCGPCCTLYMRDLRRRRKEQSFGPLPFLRGKDREEVEPTPDQVERLDDIIARRAVIIRAENDAGDLPQGCYPAGPRMGRMGEMLGARMSEVGGQTGIGCELANFVCEGEDG